MDLRAEQISPTLNSDGSLTLYELTNENSIIPSNIHQCQLIFDGNNCVHLLKLESRHHMIVKKATSRSFF